MRLRWQERLVIEIGMGGDKGGLTPAQYEILFGEPPPPPRPGATPTSESSVGQPSPPPPKPGSTPTSGVGATASAPASSSGPEQILAPPGQPQLAVPIQNPKSVGVTHSRGIGRSIQRVAAAVASKASQKTAATASGGAGTHKSLPPNPPSRNLRSTSWVPPGGSFEIDGLTINSGMVFVGTELSSLDGTTVEPALINPKLKVNWRSPDTTGSTMGYWPSYDSMRPEARAAYLSWLGTGRCDPDAYIGYVFVFFYGLERRILTNMKSSPGQAGLRTLVEEVKRLFQIYQHNGSFSGYARRLLDYVNTVQSIDLPSTLPTAGDTDHWELPFSISLGLGKLVAENRPIPPKWALAYLRGHPSSYLRTPATRCVEVFDQLFESRYVAAHADGITMRAPGTRLTLSYQPASGGISPVIDSSLQNIPDVSATPYLIDALKQIATDCTEELDSYSRFLGKNPGQQESLEAIALLPGELVAGLQSENLDRLRAWAISSIGDDQQVVCELDALVEAWSPGRSAKLDKRSSASLAAMLGKIGVGLEPDVRFGAATPKPGSVVVLFPLTASAPTSPSAAYAAASSVVHLTAVIASADGNITSEEQLHMAKYLEEVLALEDGERNRLEAHLTLLGASTTKTTGLKKKVASLAPADLASIGRFLIDVAAADGVVCPDEIAMLVKVFPYLGLSESSVYSAIHALGSSDAGPVLVAEGNGGEGWSLPPDAKAEPEKSNSRTTVSLDMEKVRSRQAESSKVEALLADIFAEETETTDATEPGPAKVTIIDGPKIDGLDAPHNELAMRLSDVAVTLRESAVEIGKSLGLPLLDGALDRINEASLDICGEPLIEGSENLETNAYAKEHVFQ